MLRRFLRNFDVGAARWLAENENLVEEFMMDHLDRLTPSERLKLYVMLFGFFRKSYGRVIDARLKLEADAKCREVLVVVEEEHRVAIGQPYSRITDAELQAGAEKNLAHKDPGLRYLGALGIWTLTKDATKIIPVLRDILQGRSSQAREQAAELLGRVSPLDEDTIQTLLAVANDQTDPVRFLAKKALSNCRESG